MRKVWFNECKKLPRNNTILVIFSIVKLYCPEATKEKLFEI